MTTLRSVAAALSIISGFAAGAAAQSPAAEPFAITDNSFFVEEAFNQERGVFQNILVWEKVRDGGWDGSFTQEFPAPAIRHQLSYTLPFDGGTIGTHIGGVLINYRFQALEEGAGRPAFSPRFSVVLPTGRNDGYGDRTGIQVNLPVSKQAGDVYLHANAGFTRLFNVKSLIGPAVVGFEPETRDLTSPTLAGSVIYRVTQMFNLLVESGVEFVDDFGQSRQASVLVSPGFRTGWNLAPQSR
jgi:hypothetical protein